MQYWVFLAVTNYIVLTKMITITENTRKKTHRDKNRSIWEQLRNVKSKKLKILIATGIFPPDIGGPATVLEALAHSLENNRFEVKILTYSDKVLNPEKNINRVNRKQNLLLRYSKFFFKMLELSKWADITYVTDTYSVGYFAYLIKKITGQKYILRFAGDSAWETAVGRGWTTDYVIDFQDKTYNNRIEIIKGRRKKVLTHANNVIAVSRFIAELASKIGVDRNRIKVIYNSVDFITNNAEQAVDIRSKYGNKTRFIVTACRLTPWKGVDGIIRIIPELTKRTGEVHLLILGDGQELENLKKLATDLKVRKKVHFMGRVDHNKITGFFRESDLFILNTNYEGLSHTILEAMKAGVPIITTRVGGNPEVIEDNQTGLLVDYNNEKELLNAVVKIFTDDVLSESLKKNAKNKLKKFSWLNTVNETVKLINETIYEKNTTY